MSAPQRWPFKKGTPAARTQKSRLAVNQRIQQSMLLRKRVTRYATERSVEDIRRDVKAACTFDAETIDEFRAVDLRITPKRAKSLLDENDVKGDDDAGSDAD